MSFDCYSIVYKQCTNATSACAYTVTRQQHGLAQLTALYATTVTLSTMTSTPSPRIHTCALLAPSVVPHV